MSDDDNEDIGTKKKMALLDVLHKSTINGQPLTYEEIVDDIGAFIFVGHDTTTTTSFFSSQNAEVQQNVYEEVTSIVGDNLSDFLTYNQLREMKYLECCIREALTYFNDS